MEEVEILLRNEGLPVVNHNDHLMVGEVTIKLIYLDENNRKYAVSGFIGMIGSADVLNTPEEVVNWVVGNVPKKKLEQVLEAIMRAAVQQEGQEPPAPLA